MAARGRFRGTQTVALAHGLMLRNNDRPRSHCAETYAASSAAPCASQSARQSRSDRPPCRGVDEQQATIAHDLEIGGGLSAACGTEITMRCPGASVEMKRVGCCSARRPGSRRPGSHPARPCSRPLRPCRAGERFGPCPAPVPPRGRLLRPGRRKQLRQGMRQRRAIRRPAAFKPNAELKTDDRVVWLAIVISSTLVDAASAIAQAADIHSRCNPNRSSVPRFSRSAGH